MNRSILTRNIVQMNNVWASFGAEYILRGVSLTVERGSNYAVIGKSGSGKSTLLKLINSMMVPRRGTVKTDYMTPDSGNKKFRDMMSRIGYIPQNLGLVRNFTVLDNTLVGALPRMGQIKSLLKMFPRSEIEEAKRILDMVGLGSKYTRKAHALSGGEKRRVAIARALMQKPEILLADEIVSELDRATAFGIMNVIREAQKELDLTSIMVHHDIELALKYADRVAVLQEGKKILEIGVEGDQIVDFESGGMTRGQIMEEYKNRTQD